MFDISFTELLVIGAVALVVIGPERLPKVARTVGHLLGRAQRYVSDVKSDIQREMELDELKKFKAQMDEAASSLKTSLREAESSIRQPLDQFQDEVSKLASTATAMPQQEPPSAPETALQGPAAPVVATTDSTSGASGKNSASSHNGEIGTDAPPTAHPAPDTQPPKDATAPSPDDKPAAPSATPPSSPSGTAS
ncbi:Sec-independent protein translocase protein TatB [Kerstersia similis]|uniref:Sec-independent protein translocase protein TatB n=1 Tax=Kerstersia similis TaxID=206505 RepID=UPI0039EEAF72